MNRLQISILALTAALPMVAQAQDFVLDEIVVSANRTETLRSRTGASVVVVSEEDLKKAGDTSVAALLAKVPGISVAQQGPFGNTANLAVRGASTKYLAVFIDGIRVDDPSSITTMFEFGSLLASDVGRIEVLRGSQSALWGGSAVGGVINITTKAAKEEGTHQSVEVEGGSYGSAKLSYGLTQKTGALEATLNVAHFETDGFSAAASGTEADGARADRVSVGLRYTLSDSVTLGASAFAQDTYQEYDGFSNSPPYGATDADNLQNRLETGARLYAEITAGRTDHAVNLTTFNIERSYGVAASEGTFSGQRNRLDWQATSVYNDALTMVYGADITEEKATVNSVDSSFAPYTVTETTSNAGAFAQALWAVNGQLDVAGTLRWDDNQSFGGFGTGRLALAWRPKDGLTFRAVAATGFRAPSLNELYADYTAYGYANNPNLTPETSRSFELGVEKTYASGASVQAAVFQLDITDAIGNDCIAPDPDGSCPGFSYILNNQAGVSTRKGVELSATLPVGEAYGLSMAYTYLDAKSASGTAVGGLAEHDLRLGLDAALSDNLTATFGAHHVAGMADTFGSTKLPSFTTLDANLTYAISDSAEAYLRIENLTDERYQQAKDYNSAERSFYVGLRAKF